MGEFHSKLSPSKADAVVHCPGSMAYQSLNPFDDDKTSDYALEGTCAHFFLEYSLSKKEIGYYPVELKGKFIVHHMEKFIFSIVDSKPEGLPKHYFIQEINDDILEGITTALEYVYNLLEDYDLGFSNMMLEERVYPLLDYPETSGTADIIIHDRCENLWVIDYKHGKGVEVPVEGNYQALAYTLGSKNHHFSDFKNYYNVIIQPFLGGVKVVKLLENELQEFEDTYRKSALNVENIMEALLEGWFSGFRGLEEELNIGKQCRFCPLISYCPKYESLIEELLGIDMTKKPQEILLDESRIEQILPWVEYIENYLKKVYATATKEAMNGRKFEGFELKDGRSSRKFCELEEGEIERILIDDFKLSKKDLYSEPEFLSVAQIEKKIDRKRREEYNEKLTFSVAGFPKLVKSKNKSSSSADDNYFFED